MRFDLLNEYGSAYRGPTTKSSLPDEGDGFDERNPVPLRTGHAHWFGSLAPLAMGAAVFTGVLRMLSLK